MYNQDEIVSFLCNQKIVDESEIKTALDECAGNDEDLISVLKKKQLIAQEDILKVTAFTHKIEFITLSPDMVDPIAAHILPYDIVSRHNIIPVRLEDNKLFVAMDSPLDLAIRDQVETKTGYKVVPLAATEDAIRQAIMYYFNVQNITKQDIVSMRLKQPAGKKIQNEQAQPKSEKVTNAPVSRLVQSVINGAIDARASDIHIEPQEPDLRVRYRIDGILRDALDIPSSVQLEVISHIKILAEMDISEKRVPQDGHMAIHLNGKDYDLRISSLPAVGGEKIVIRILDKNSKKWELDEIVSSEDDNKKFRALASNPHGMILLTGPTGSGKTTTLYALLQLLNTPEKNIVTVEDPVEYRLSGITQVQVKPVAGMTFAKGLRSILRQDPDIILIGEIRDLETAEIAVSAALTGHLVLSTLHTNDAAGAVSRLINIGVPPFLVASSLLGSVSQRLVRRLCPKCKESYYPDEDELKLVFKDPEKYKGMTMYRGKKCNSCYQTGYHGRDAIYEILVVSPQIQRMIATQTDDNTIKEQACKEGLKNLYTSAVEKLEQGITTIQELFRVVDVRE
ncbi:MAG: GspE/PulE family protein [Planctomycetota bacterium]